MAAIKFDILKRFSSEVAFTAEIEVAEDAPVSLKIGAAVRWAINARANLSGADLSGANLSRATLSRADLSGADLSDANLSSADLSDANLSGADLSGANLSRADLSDANLSSADLSDANLSSADLSGANLSRANLSGANLIDGGQRSDGYRFVGSIRDGALMISAGCRYFTLAEARTHWAATRGGTPLGKETMAILDHVEAVALIRGLVVEAEIGRVA